MTEFLRQRILCSAVIGLSRVIANSMILATLDLDRQVCWKRQLRGENGKELKQLFRIFRFISTSFLKYSTLFFCYFLILLKKKGELIKKENWKMRMPTFPTPPPLSDCSRSTHLSYVGRPRSFDTIIRSCWLNYQVDFLSPLIYIQRPFQQSS